MLHTTRKLISSSVNPRFQYKIKNTAKDCEIIDTDMCSLNAVDTIFIHANLKEKKPSFAEKAYGGVLIKNTKHLMARYQFIIALVRIAYAKNGGVGRQRGKLSDALRIVFKEHIDRNAQR